ncbi:NAD-dependent epimerase/dehydratase family protein [Microbacterium sp. AK031]|uniref:NAD-dependent epimerase/dehydratase family protein n=1 Tax=Microbacterium sp. AK031 TaxID=2723076 RepID=UPI0021699D2B|nr:NAD-dependent epimerase/dehydratase family protein [Microbacterium sp. AK031]MCS3841809.1 nucleoside-diphosphate-sugar epimerase [Microbacterium sp. AK031]
MTSILYLGGTGTISAACVRRSIERGHDVTVVNRGSARRALPDGVTVISADIHDAAALTAALGGREFDTVADFLSFTPADLERNLGVFEGHTGQYIFISSASAYQKPPARLPITEQTPLENPFWQYSRDKIACEDLLFGAHRERGLPVTVVRPSHTYDEQSIPTLGGWTDIARMRAGRPVIVHGDGTSLWTITHSDDFAVAFTGLVGRSEAIGEAHTITGSHAPTWNQIYGWLADAAGVSSPELVHVASDAIAALTPEIGPTLLGDKAHSIVFDNSKVQALVPEFATTITFDEGARRILAHHDNHPEAQVVDADRDAQFDRLAAYAAAVG